MRRSHVAAVLGASTIAAGVAALETVTGRRLSRRLARAIARTARYQSGRLDGFRYRLAGRRPNPDVEDHVLADRIRSRQGPLEHRLDNPRVHVQDIAHDVLLHGDVSSDDEADTIVEATRAIAGVHQVLSHLHVGLFAGDSRPSEGARHPAPSEGLTKMVAAAHRAGAPEGSDRAMVRSVTSAFVALLPPGERRHFLAHLPRDLRDLATPPRPRRFAHRHVRRVEDFALAALPNCEPSKRRAVVESVIGAARDLVPEEVADVAAVLPEELRTLWKTAMPA